MTLKTTESTLRDLGYRIQSTLVRDEFDGRKGNAFWAVTILRDGQSLQLDYSMGCAHRHYNRPSRPIKFPQRMTVDHLERNKRSKPNTPTLVDVMYCIVTDAQGVTDGESFEDWAGNMGYDEDSRSAEKTFQVCRQQFFGLKRMGADLDELSELFQDY